jgi:hypothetical protein
VTQSHNFQIILKENLDCLHLYNQVRKYIWLIDPKLPTDFTYIRKYKGKKPIYDVEMETVAESRAVRDGFGQFWRKKSGKRLPDALKGVTIANSTTFPTRVRVRLLKEVARRHSIANPELTCFVTNYYPRPELKIRSRKSPMVTLTYSEAVVKLPQHLTNEFLIELYEYARTVLPDEEIVERFLVLSPDLLKPGSGLDPANSSAMSVDDQQAAQGQVQAEVQVENLAEVEEIETEQIESSNNVPNGSGDVKLGKKNKNRFFQDKKKTTPYSKHP